MSLVCRAFLLVATTFLAAGSAHAATIGTFASCSCELMGVTVDRDGNVWAGDYENGQILKFAADGSSMIVVDNLGEVMGLAFDGNGNLFFAAQDTASIFEVPAQDLPQGAGPFIPVTANAVLTLP